MKKIKATVKSLTILMIAFFMVASCSQENEKIVTGLENEQMVTGLKTFNAGLEANVNDSEIMAKHYKGVKMYTAELSELNNSGVSGTAELWLDGDQLTVTIQATGLEPNQVHPQHIHGFIENNKKATCPSISADTNGDGLIDLVEGLPSYGPVLLSLTPFPMAEDGTINYTGTFTVDSDLLPIQQNAIVLHGLTVNGVYDATLPVACGEIRQKQGRR